MDSREEQAKQRGVGALKPIRAFLHCPLTPLEATREVKCLTEVTFPCPTERGGRSPEEPKEQSEPEKGEKQWQV